MGLFDGARRITQIVGEAYGHRSPIGGEVSIIIGCHRAAPAFTSTADHLPGERNGEGIGIEDRPIQITIACGIEGKVGRGRGIGWRKGVRWRHRGKGRVRRRHSRQGCVGGNGAVGAGIVARVVEGNGLPVDGDRSTNHVVITGTPVVGIMPNIPVCLLGLIVFVWVVEPSLYV